MKDYLIGIDLGGTSIKMGLVNTKGEVISKWEIPTDVSNGGCNIVDDIINSITELINKNDINKDSIIAAGMGSPGIADNAKGTISHAYNLGWVEEQQVSKKFKEKLDIDLFLENDANCAALGEKWKGSGNDEANIVFVALGTGVGGGVVIDNSIVQGVNGAGGEVGHVRINNKYNFHCACGGIGCLETVASATGIVNIAKEKLKDNKTSMLNEFDKLTCKDVFDCARKDDELSLEIVDELSTYLAELCAMVGNILNPSCIIIGGGVSRSGDLFIKQLEEKFLSMVYASIKVSTKIKLASLGSDAGMIGASFLGLISKTKK